MKLPGSYGFGQSKLADWIIKNQKADALRKKEAEKPRPTNPGRDAARARREREEAERRKREQEIKERKKREEEAKRRAKEAARITRE